MVEFSLALSFYRSQNVLGWSKFFVPEQKFICILCQIKRWFAFSKTVFSAGRKVFEEALITYKSAVKNYGLQELLSFLNAMQLHCLIILIKLKGFFLFIIPSNKWNCYLDNFQTINDCNFSAMFTTGNEIIRSSWRQTYRP